MLKKGDLVNFNDQGIELFKYISGSIGVIASDARKTYEYDFHSIPEKVEYHVYDILVCGQLFKDIPEEFIYRITKR